MQAESDVYEPLPIEDPSFLMNEPLPFENFHRNECFSFPSPKALTFPNEPPHSPPPPSLHFPLHEETSAAGSTPSSTITLLPPITVPPSPEQTQKSSRKRLRVHFATTASVYPCTKNRNNNNDNNNDDNNNNNDDDKDETNTWYTDQDYASFDMERRQTLQAVLAAQGDIRALDPTQYCLTGLQLSKRQSMQRKLRTRQCQRAVLEQQLVQRCAGMWDPDTIEAVSKVFSRASSKRALRRALLEAATL